MKGFKKLSVTGEFQPEELPLPPFISESDAVWNVKPGDGSHRVYFTPQALQELDSHIHWGRHTPQNRVEQGGLMLGNVFRDPEGGFVYGIAEHVVPMHDARGNAVFLEIDTNSFSAAITEAQKLIDQDNRLRQIGWYHTHPNGLDVFMSGTDLANQRHSFSKDWQFAVVINPHRKICRAFHGGEIKEGYCCFLYSDGRRRSPAEKFRDMKPVMITTLTGKKPEHVVIDRKPGGSGSELYFSYDAFSGMITIGKYQIKAESFAKMLRKRLEFTRISDSVRLFKQLQIGLTRKQEKTVLGDIHVIREYTWFDDTSCLKIEYGNLKMEQDSFRLNLAVSNDPDLMGSETLRNMNERRPLMVLSERSYSIYDPNGPAYPVENPEPKAEPAPQTEPEPKAEPVPKTEPAPQTEPAPKPREEQPVPQDQAGEAAAPETEEAGAEAEKKEMAESDEA